jgi:hypothetical protein
LSPDGLLLLFKGRVERVITPAQHFETGNDTDPPPEALVGGFFVFRAKGKMTRQAAGIGTDA